jgi:hypothetical protein
MWRSSIRRVSQLANGSLPTSCRRTGVANRSEADQETVSAWLTAHPELILGSLGEFETCPDWVPSMGTARPSASMMMKNRIVHGFDHTANWIAKVRNVSRLGSQVDPLIATSLAPLIEETDW